MFHKIHILWSIVGLWAFSATATNSRPLHDSRGRNVAADPDAWVTRNGSELHINGEKWTASGGNVYWLGIDENVIPPVGQPFDPALNASYPTNGRITEIMNIIKVMGGNAIRAHTLGVSVGNPLSLMPSLGVINEAAFATIDWAVYQAREHGIRLLIPLTDNYDYYHGGKFTFLRWRGFNISSIGTIDPEVQNFYTDSTIVNDFMFYIKTLLTHVNPHTNLSYADDPTIFAYETGNELGGPVFQDLDVPVSWTQTISSFIKELAPNKLVIDGTYGIKTEALSLPDVDIYSNHYYPPDNTKLTNDIALVGGANKVYLAGEYDWTNTDLGSWHSVIEAQQDNVNPIIAGDLFWSLFGHNVPDCNTFVQHNDGFTMHYDDPSNSASTNATIAQIRQHLFKMNDQIVDAALPEAICPSSDEE